MFAEEMGTTFLAGVCGIALLVLIINIPVVTSARGASESVYSVGTKYTTTYKKKNVSVCEIVIDKVHVYFDYLVLGESAKTENQWGEYRQQTQPISLP